MKPRPLVIGTYALWGFVMAFVLVFWITFRWLHYGYTKWLVDSGDWVSFDVGFSVLFGVLIAAIPVSAAFGCPIGTSGRKEAIFRGSLWLIAASAFFLPCLSYQHQLERSAKGPVYPDSILVWPVLYYLAMAIGVVLLTGWTWHLWHTG